MAFVAGLIVGLLAGALSRLLAAAWLETQRLWGNGANLCGRDLSEPSSFDGLQNPDLAQADGASRSLYVVPRYSHNFRQRRVRLLRQDGISGRQKC
jgi:hypothetical protein